jgi:hypothetical protein
LELSSLVGHEGTGTMTEDAVVLEYRYSDDGIIWSEWQPLNVGVFIEPHEWYQARAYFPDTEIYATTPITDYHKFKEDLDDRRS